MTKAVVFMFGFQFIIFLMWRIRPLTVTLKDAGMVPFWNKRFPGPKCDRDYHELHCIYEVIFEQRLKHIRTAHNVYVGAVSLFELPYLLGEIAAQENARLPIA